MELRVVRLDGEDDRFLLSWAPCEVEWVWAPDGSGLFAVLAGDWDWQLWEIPLDDGSPRALVREAAAIGGVAAAPDGRRVAIAAAADLNYGRERREVFVIDLETAVVRRFNVDSWFAHDVAWLDDVSLLVVASDPVTAAVPRRRELRRLVLPEGRTERFP
jgi:tricorn protease-like protein